MFEPYGGYTQSLPWNDDLCDFSDYAAEINDLFLRYDEITEKILSEDFSEEGTFYEAKSPASTYWLFLAPDGKVTNKIQR